MSQDDMPRPETVADLLAAMGGGENAMRVPVDSWGKWKLHRKEKLLIYSEPGVEYEIDLLSVVSSASLLNWIVQLSEKTWLTVEELGNLVRALSEIFNPQSTLCGSGIEAGNFDVEAHLNYVLGEGKS